MTVNLRVGCYLRRCEGARLDACGRGPLRLCVGHARSDDDLIDHCRFGRTVASTRFPNLHRREEFPTRFSGQLFSRRPNGDRLGAPDGSRAHGRRTCVGALQRGGDDDPVRGRAGRPVSVGDSDPRLSHQLEIWRSSDRPALGRPRRHWQVHTCREISAVRQSLDSRAVPSRLRRWQGVRLRAQWGRRGLGTGCARRLVRSITTADPPPPCCCQNENPVLASTA